MLDKCISLCAKFPDGIPCAVCLRKAGVAPILKKARAQREKEIRALKGEVARLRQRFENRTWKFMRVRPNPRQAQMRMPQALRDFTRAHIARN